MPSFLVQFSYGPQAIAALVKKPTDRSEVIQALMKKIGGKLVGSWLSFGDYDGVLIVEGAEAVDAAAISMAVAASGSFKAFKTTPLLTAAEGVEAMRKAGTLGYAPPGA
jgi:uncharacterized protein with GYD domain